MRAKLWPTGLIGRVGLVLFVAVLLELLGSTFVFEQAEIVSSDDIEIRHIASQLDTASRVLGDIDTAHREEVSRALADENLSLSWKKDVGELALSATDKRSRRLRGKLLQGVPSLAERHLALQAETAADAARGSLQLADGSLVEFRITGLGRTVPAIYTQLGSVFILSCCVLLAALLVVRTLAAPLRMLVKATNAIGHGPIVHLDDTQGPREIRGVARAFNAMQTRIEKLITDRTHALAAVSHDLRTPIARMKLRADLSESMDEKAAFGADLSEMEAMLNDLLAYLGGETDPEQPKRTDIAAMLQTIVDDATDAGHAATYTGPDHLAVNVRSLAIKRALSNIVNNAIAYGDCADIIVDEKVDAVQITVDDAGPGIPERDQPHVFEPFYRGDESRNRSKGGMGLGLAITRQAVWRENGTIVLKNRAEGGLRALVSLPNRTPTPT